MSATVLHTPTSPTLPMLNTPPPSLAKWEIELSYLELEVKFYRKLTRMGLRNGAAMYRPMMANLLESFVEYDETILPNMRKVLTAGFGQTNKMAAHAEDIEKKLNRHHDKLLGLKKQVFPLFSAFQQVRIL